MQATSKGINLPPEGGRVFSFKSSFPLRKEANISMSELLPLDVYSFLLKLHLNVLIVIFFHHECITFIYMLE